MSFADTSSKIIRESISSAIYIDDKVRLPFEADIEDGRLLDQSALFESFKEKNCYLDFNRYIKGSGVDYAARFTNKDLLMLDWHLDENEADVSGTFELLQKAIKTQSLHFCVIYTNQDQETLGQKVVSNIASYFSGITKAVADAALQKFEQLVDDTGLSEGDATALTSELQRLCAEVFFEQENKERKKELLREIRGQRSAVATDIEFSEFLNGLGFPTDNPGQQLILLGFVLSGNEFPDESNEHSVSLTGKRDMIRIDRLYINVFSKKEITDSELYSAFTEALMQNSNIFLTLLGLEIRNRFRETSGFIGKELDDLNQLAFFFHRTNKFSDQKDLFDEFLKEIWKDQVSSFLLEKDIELFGVIDEFEADNDIAKKLDKFSKGNPKDREDIAKLNFVYNRLVVRRKENDMIRFGDIFRMNLGQKLGNVLLLCLTPHCDCLRPEKIKNMYFFVEGTEIALAKGVEKNDGSFISYLEIDGELTCVDWTNETKTADCKPFSLYIKSPLMKGQDRSVWINYRAKARQAVYIGTLKENYAQRIANKAFFYPLRVGIDFASFSE